MAGTPTDSVNSMQDGLLWNSVLLADFTCLFTMNKMVLKITCSSLFDTYVVLKVNKNFYYPLIQKIFEVTTESQAPG